METNSESMGSIRPSSQSIMSSNLRGLGQLSGKLNVSGGSPGSAQSGGSQHMSGPITENQDIFEGPFQQGENKQQLEDIQEDDESSVSQQLRHSAHRSRSFNHSKAERGSSDSRSNSRGSSSIHEKLDQYSSKRRGRARRRSFTF